MQIKFLIDRVLVRQGDIVIKNIRADVMLVDLLIKGLRPVDFKRHVINMSVLIVFYALSCGSM